MNVCHIILLYSPLQHNIAVKKYYHNDTSTYGAVTRKTAIRDRVKNDYRAAVVGIIYYYRVRTNDIIIIIIVICFNDIIILTLIFFDYYSNDDDSATSEHHNTTSYQEIYGKLSFRSIASRNICLHAVYNVIFFK